MAKNQFIAPFPVDEDRRRFAAWLSGFTDGEGCFQLQFSTHDTPIANFVLALRKDDAAILETIQSFFQCGRLYQSRRALRGKVHYVTIFMVQKIDDLVEHIVPHFEQFPLLSKKRNDIPIWKEGVSLIANRNRKGLHRRWDKDEIARFTVLHDTLREQRKFIPPSE